MNQSILRHDTVALAPTGDAIRIIDQTQLPAQLVFLDLHTQPGNLGAPLNVSKSAALPPSVWPPPTGSTWPRERFPATEPSTFLRELHTAADYLASSRPTAVNLRWALNRMEDAVANLSSVPAIRETLLRESNAIHDEDIRVCQKIGTYGLELLQPGWGILTHCNAGQLATVKYGTATAPIYLGQQQGYHFRVFADENPTAFAGGPPHRLRAPRRRRRCHTDLRQHGCHRYETGLDSSSPCGL